MMKVKNIIIAVCLILVVGGILGCFYYFNAPASEEYAVTLDLKEKYEALNGVVRESDKATYQNVFIDSTIEINVLDINETIEFVQNGTGILFIGAPWCPWCRNALPVLMSTAAANNLVINYLDITDIRNVYEINDGKLVKTQVEAEGYYELLEALDSALGDATYTLTDEVGKVYDTKEKRIYMPSAYAIKNGNIEDTHVSTVNLKDGQTKYDKLDKNQLAELTNIYQNLIDKTKGLNVCGNETLCD